MAAPRCRTASGRARGKAIDSFAQLERAVAPLLAEPGWTQIAARATVTRHDFDLSQRFADILAIGFPEVGFAPLRMDKGRGDALREQDWPAYLDALKRLARSEIARARSGAADPSKQPRHRAQADRARRQFALSVRRWRRLFFRGRGRPLVCLSSRDRQLANSRWATVPDSTTSGGAISSNVVTSTPRRRAGPAGRATCVPVPATRKPPRAAKSACDFIRGWLEFCFGVYCELSALSVATPHQGLEAKPQ